MDGQMTNIDELYPPSIQNAPAGLTNPSGAYRRQVVVVLISLLIFTLFYMALVIASGFGTVLLIVAGGWPASILTGIIFLFLIKGVFKSLGSKEERDMRIEVTEQEHPKLFAFLRKLCADTGAPFPHRVFLTADVNASVFYNGSMLSVFLPGKKNLLIGLGLVNGLTLDEFKAVLAHEFGHFAQSSMRIGSYVYSTNRVIYDLVYERDQFDDFLAGWRRTNIRLAIFAYIITGVLWVLRKIMQGAYRLINLWESALSREMEFHADLVAVSVTGSDSLIHALKKLSFLSTSLGQTAQDLRSASEHRLFTDDLYLHHAQAGQYLRRRLNEPQLGLVPALPEAPIKPPNLFTRENADTVDQDGMWASHPSHFDREVNAKRHYLRSVLDDRSPWLLFSNPESLRKRMTERFYRYGMDLKPINMAPAQQVQAFLDEEHDEMLQNPRYQGLYDGRPLSIPADQLTLLANDPALPTMPAGRIQTLTDTLYKATYKDWLEGHFKRKEEEELLEALKSGDTKTKGETFAFRNRRYRPTEVPNLLKMIEGELEADKNWLRGFDREVFLVHLRMAQLVGSGDDDLFQRYYFHLNLQDIFESVYLEEARLIMLFQMLSTKESRLSSDDFEGVVRNLRQAHQNIALALNRAHALAMPPLQNMRAGIPVSDYLLQEPFVPPLPPEVSSLDGKWPGALMKQIGSMKSRCRRLYFKSMGAILSRQETIFESYQGKPLEISK